MGKSLWTSNGDGNKVFVYTGTNEYDEARYIARQIKKHFDEQGHFRIVRYYTEQMHNRV